MNVSNLNVGKTKALSLAKGLAALLITGSFLSQLNAQTVVFQDNYSRPDVPPAASDALAGSLPQVGAAYSGNGTVMDVLQATGVDLAAGQALGGGNFLKTGGGGFSSSKALLTSLGEAETQGKIVQVSFDFYMATGSGDMDFNSFAGSGTFGRGFDILLASTGQISWYASNNPGGDFINTGGSFALDQKHSFVLAADFGNQTFSANIGDFAFNGNLSPSSSGIGNLLFYSSGTPSFYVDNLSITVVPEPSTMGLALSGVAAFAFFAQRRRK